MAISSLRRVISALCPYGESSVPSCLRTVPLVLLWTGSGSVASLLRLTRRTVLLGSCVVAGLAQSLWASAQDEAARLELEGDSAMKLAEPSYRDAVGSWDAALSLAARIGDAAALKRTEEARAALACLLKDSRLFELVREARAQRGDGSAPLRPDALGGCLTAGPFALAGQASVPLEESLRRLARFLAAARRSFQKLPEREERDGLSLVELEALVFKAMGDFSARAADAAYRRALASLDAASQGETAGDRSRLEASRFRLLWKLRDFQTARRLLASSSSLLAALSAAERAAHLQTVLKLAILYGDRAGVLATLSELNTLGAKAEEPARPGARFDSPLLGSAVDLAQTAQTLLELLASHRLTQWERALVASMAGIAAAELGEYALAEEILRSHPVPTSLESGATAFDDPWLGASVAARLGFIRGELGSHEAALAALDESWSLAERCEGAGTAKGASLGRFRSRIALNAARSYLALGQLDRAREKAMWVLSTSPGTPDLAVRARILLGNVLYERAREEPRLLVDARGTFQAARRDLDTVRSQKVSMDGAAELEVTIAINLANVLRAEGNQQKGDGASTRRKEAIELQDRAMRAAHGAGLYQLAAVASANLGELHLEAGDLAAASGFVNWALERAKERRLLETEWRCHWYLGRIAEAEGRGEAADAEYATAEAIVDSYRSSILDAEKKSGFLTDKMALYRDMVRRNLARNRPDEALATAERSKARTLTDSLGLRFLTLSDPSQTELYRSFVSLMSRAEKARESPTSSLLGVRAKPMDYTDLKNRLSELRARIERTVPPEGVLRALIGGNALGAREILDALPKGSTLLEYFSLGESYVALVAADGRIEGVQLSVTPAEIARCVTRYILDGAQDPKDAARLYSWLFEPLEGKIRGGRVLIIPHDVLHNVPFETLRDGKGYLVERFEFVYLPSATMMRYLKRKPGFSPGTLNLLAVADPDTDYNRDGRPEMPPLPFAREEVKGFASSFREREILEGPEAAKTRCAEEISKFDVIHYACHGEFYANRPWDSALYLAPGTGGKQAQDGRLRASEVYALDLRRSRLVALSGCETGRSQILPGDDTISIATAFLYSGASSLLVSLWKVEDQATSALMRSFYRRWLEEGKDKARALRESKLELLAGKFAHPRQWAAFVLIGEP